MGRALHLTDFLEAARERDAESTPQWPPTVRIMASVLCEVPQDGLW